MVCLGVVILLIPMTSWLSAKQASFRRELLQWTDKRVGLMSEIIMGIQVWKCVGLKCQKCGTMWEFVWRTSAEPAWFAWGLGGGCADGTDGGGRGCVDKESAPAALCTATALRAEWTDAPSHACTMTPSCIRAMHLSSPACCTSHPAEPLTLRPVPR